MNSGPGQHGGGRRRVVPPGQHGGGRRGVVPPGQHGQRQVRWLLRCYPRSWRVRYGEEFAELLAAELAEQPRNWRRTLDVVSSGLLARCTQAGLTGHELPPADQIRAGLATIGCAVGAIGLLGMFMLAQLATGWQWVSTWSASAAVGTLVMAMAAGLLALSGLAAVVPVGWHAVVAIVRGSDPRLARPACIALGCAILLVVGTRHFQNGWPGTGGGGAEHGLVPAGLAAFGWASTLSVSAYWAHPVLWASFPAPELAWMTLSPVAWVGLTAGAVTVLRRLVLPSGLLRYLGMLAMAATVIAAGFLTGAATWVLASDGQPGLLRPGLVDTGGLLIMSLALVVTMRAAGAVRRARLTITSRNIL